MNKYEAMLIIKPDLSEDDQKNLFNQLKDAVTKNNGEIQQADIWLKKRDLCFTIKKYRQGLYYLMNFELAPASVGELNQAYKLNEHILRVLITRVNQ